MDCARESDLPSVVAVLRVVTILRMVTILGMMTILLTIFNHLIAILIPLAILETTLVVLTICIGF